MFWMFLDDWLLQFQNSRHANKMERIRVFISKIRSAKIQKYGLQIEDFVTLVRRFDDGFGALRMRIGYEQLPKVVVVDHFYDLADARFIEFVKNVIKQKNWFFARFFFDEIELRQFERDQKRFLLALRTEFLDRIVVDLERQIVFVDANRSVLQHTILLQIFVQQRQQTLVVQRAFVNELHRFGRACNHLVVLVEDRDEIGDEVLSFFENLLSEAVELFVVNRQGIGLEHMIERKIFEQCVALGEDFLVLDELLQITRIELRDHAVDEFAPGFAAFGDQIDIGGRNHDQRNESDVIREFIIDFAVALEDFLLSFFKAAHDLLKAFLFLKFAVDHKKLLAVLDVLYRQRIEIAFAVRQMIDRIEHIGLADAVLADKTIDLCVERKIGFGEVLVVEKRNLF